MQILWSDRAWENYLDWKKQDPQIHKRINRLIRDIEMNGYEGIGKPEPLKANLSGWWSRRITGYHRLVYRKKDGSIEIIQCRGHYDD